MQIGASVVEKKFPRDGRYARSVNAKDAFTLFLISRRRSTSSQGARMYGLTERTKSKKRTVTRNEIS